MLKWRLLLLSLTLAPLLRAQASSQVLNGAQRPGISIVIESAQTTGSYIAYVNRKTVRAPRYLLDALGELLLKSGRDTPVLVLVHEQVPLNRVAELLGMVDKAGFSTVHAYYFDSHRRFMVPINFGRAVPFSTKTGQ